MSRKHFRLIAEALKRAQASREVCEFVASGLVQTNPRFDRTRFMEACGHL